ncbi:MAG: response regulator [Gemmatimonadales bacterium]
MPLDTTNLAIQFAAIVLEFLVAVLVWMLFALSRRRVMHRAYFAEWTSAWFWMTIAVGAVGVRYILLPATARNLTSDADASVRLLYALYQVGKLLFWTRVYYGALEYARHGYKPSPAWLFAPVAYGVVSLLVASNLNSLIVWQAPVAIWCSAGAAAALFRLPADRRSLGSVATGAALAATAVLWTGYLVAFSGLANELPVTPFGREVTRYNSYADMLMIVGLGYAMLVLFMEDARHRISDSETRLATLVASVADAILTTDDQLNVIEMNAAAERLFGVRRETAIGSSFADFVAERDRSRLRALLADFLASGDVTTMLPGEEELHALRRDGSSFTFEASTSKLRADTATSLALVVRDVTERREAEEKRRQTQKMDAVRQLAGGLAHDFNNLLTAIVGRSQIIVRSLPADSAVRDGVSEIEKTATAAARLARGLLALSRREPLHPQRLSLNDIVRDLEPKIRAEAGPAVAVEFRYDAAAGDVQVDTGRVQDVVLAITQNAREAIGAQHGRISLETSRVTWQREAGRNLDAACVIVRDSGPGFSAEARTHLFEPFYSTKGDSRGLGLATAYGFLQQSGGFIDVQGGSSGASVRIGFPLVLDEPISAPRPIATDRTQSAGPRTVLVAEDEETVRRFVRIVLEKEGFRVLEAENGMDALAVFEAAEPAPDILLTDVVMPQMGGQELAKRLVVVRPGLKVIFMSGFVRDPDLLEGLNERRAPFLQKPFDIEELARIVRAAAAS